MDQNSQMNLHLSFVVRMLHRAKNTEHEKIWENLLNMMQNDNGWTNDKKNLVNDTLNKLVLKLRGYAVQNSQNNKSKISNTTQKDNHHKQKKKKKNKIKFLRTMDSTIKMMSPRREGIPILKIKLSEIYNVKRQKQEKRKRKILEKASLREISINQKNITHENDAKKHLNSEKNEKYNLKNCYVKLNKLDSNHINELRKKSLPKSESNSNLLNNKTNVNVSQNSSKGVKLKSPKKKITMQLPQTSPNTRSKLKVSTAYVEKNKDLNILKSILSTPPKTQVSSVSQMESSTPIVQKSTARKSTSVLLTNKPLSSSVSQNSIENFKFPQNLPKSIKSETNPVDVVQISKNYENESAIPMISIPTDLIFKKNENEEHGKEILLSAEFTTKKIRPWLSNSSHRKVLKNCEEMLSNGNCLAATFKCMGSTCSYFTNEPSIFSRHLEFHVKHTEHDLVNFQKCCYCNYENLSSKELINHIINIHGANRYQCPYCFYRSYDVHIFTHLKYFHNSKSEIAIECKPLKTINVNDNMKKVWTDFIKICRSISCFVCKSKFYNIKNFSMHIDQHKTIPSFKCIKCTQEVIKEQIITHLKTCHGFGNINCAFCNFATDSLETIKQHLTNHHPNSLLYYYDRSTETSNSHNIQPESKEEVSKVLILKQLTSYINNKDSYIKAFTNKILLDNIENVGKGFDLKTE